MKKEGRKYREKRKKEKWQLPRAAHLGKLFLRESGNWPKGLSASFFFPLTKSFLFVPFPNSEWFHSVSSKVSLRHSLVKINTVQSIIFQVTE